MSNDDPISRREALARTAAAGLVLAGCAPAGSAGSAGRGGPAPSSSREDPSREDRSMTSSATVRMPVIYVPHGGGPWPFVSVGFGSPAEWDRLRGYLTGLSGALPAKPRALLVVTAHWEERVPTVSTAAHPPMLYDYSGFPPESYRIEWPAPGEPRVAERVRELLGAAGIDSAADAQRGFDHGTFVPMKLSFPEADVPCVQLSLRRDLDPAAHLAIGRALEPLRSDGVLVVGSGMSFHNMRGFGSSSALPASVAFDTWVRETVALPPSERDARLVRWQEAPSARFCHPREEHLLPLMVIAGAAGRDRGDAPYSDVIMSTRVSAVHFG